MNIIYVYIWVIAYIKSQIASFEIYQLQNLFFFLLLLLLMAMGFESRALCNHSTTWARPPALLFLFCFWDKVIFTLLGWPQTCDVCLLRSWDYRCAPSYLDTKSFFFWVIWSSSYWEPQEQNMKHCATSENARKGKSAKTDSHFSCWKGLGQSWSLVFGLSWKELGIRKKMSQLKINHCFYVLQIRSLANCCPPGWRNRGR
jgi:hypothetical protein